MTHRNVFSVEKTWDQRSRSSPLLVWLSDLHNFPNLLYYVHFINQLWIVHRLGFIIINNNNGVTTSFDREVLLRVLKDNEKFSLIGLKMFLPKSTFWSHRFNYKGKKIELDSSSFHYLNLVHTRQLDQWYKIDILNYGQF